MYMCEALLMQPGSKWFGNKFLLECLHHNINTHNFGLSYELQYHVLIHTLTTQKQMTRGLQRRHAYTALLWWDYWASKLPFNIYDSVFIKPFQFD